MLRCARYVRRTTSSIKLSGNRQVLLQPCVTEIADRHNKSVPQVVYRFALQLGMLPLTGTTDGTHMRHNLDIFDFTLTRDETETMLALGGSEAAAPRAASWTWRGV